MQLVGGASGGLVVHTLGEGLEAQRRSVEGEIGRQTLRERTDGMMESKTKTQLPNASKREELLTEADGRATG